VDSAVVVLDRHQPLVDDPEGFLEFVGLCFRQKRKTLRNNLSGAYGNVVDAWPEARLRAEQVPFDGFVEMYRRVTP
jgi:16S rRNA A1518/A1519 N6-dimethyltransferase RsmA/KsgA/DIM1 with predicted DNA glycosylase/AP lyase activity